MIDLFERIAKRRLMQPRTLCRYWLSISLLLGHSAIGEERQPLDIVGLSYPQLARQARVTGLVVVRITVEDDGAVSLAEVVSGHPLLGEAAKENAERWRFKKQTTFSGRNPDAYLVYRFLLEGTCAGNDCRTGFVAELPNFILVTSEIPSIQISREREQ
jgi:TonB family protein